MERLYLGYECPNSQQVWITRNCKGLQDVIKLVPVRPSNMPAWYKEKVCSENKVPALEHNNRIITGGSLNLVKYINDTFEGTQLLPDEPAKVNFAEELISYYAKFSKACRMAFIAKLYKKFQDTFRAMICFDDLRDAVDYLEKALSKFDDGPFFLGQFSLVDIVYAPIFERCVPLMLELWQHDIRGGRHKLAFWINEMDKIEAYTPTKVDMEKVIEEARPTLPLDL